MTDTPTEREAESTWTRLRRRKVVQWGVVYVAAAWGFLQGLEYVSEASSGRPAPAGRASSTPDRPAHRPGARLVPRRPRSAAHHDPRVRDPHAAPAARRRGVLVLPARQRSRRNDARTRQTTAQRDTLSGVKDARPSIAVLPFENRSRLEDDAFFVDGIHDDILTQLTKVGALKVIARTSVEQFRDTNLTIREIGQKLGVDENPRRRCAARRRSCACHRAIDRRDVGGPHVGGELRPRAHDDQHLRHPE